MALYRKSKPYFLHWSLRMIYLASPYSDPDPHTRVQRYYSVMECVKNLVKQNIIVFSPILHNHELASKCNLPKDAKYWQTHNENFMSIAEEIFVLASNGWKTSLGVQVEIKWALDNGKRLTIIGVKGIPAGEKV